MEYAYNSGSANATPAALHASLIPDAMPCFARNAASAALPSRVTGLIHLPECMRRSMMTKRIGSSMYQHANSARNGTRSHKPAAHTHGSNSAYMKEISITVPNVASPPARKAVFIAQLHMRITAAAQ